MTKIKNALEKSAHQGKVTALSEDGKILLMIQDSPEELRRLADEMERLGVEQIKAFIAYSQPNSKELSVTKTTSKNSSKTNVIGDSISEQNASKES